MNIITKALNVLKALKNLDKKLARKMKLRNTRLHNTRTCTHEAVLALCEEKVDAHEDETNGVDFMYEEGVLNGTGSAALYSPQYHMIVLSSSVKEIIAISNKVGVKWERYVDAVMCHEMGHAVDPGSQSLMHAMMSCESMESALEFKNKHVLELEMNAWTLGKQFTKDEKFFDWFNQKNMNVYEKRMKGVSGK